MMRLAATILASLLLVGAARAADDGDAQCRINERMLLMNGALPVTQTRLAQHAPLVVVAIGSSSTQGFGSSEPARSYPAQLEAELKQHHPGQSIRVLNMGVGGETAQQMLDRFERDVVAHAPHLVIWQTGANDAMRGVELEEFAATLERGLSSLKARGYDLVLMPPQYAPRVVAAPQRDAFLQRMYAIARAQRVPLFQRYEIMRELAEREPEALQTLLNADGLHLNDLGYRCLARQLARAIERSGLPASDTAMAVKPQR